MSSFENDNLDDFLDLLENDADENDKTQSSGSSSAPSSSTLVTTPFKKPLQELTYEDLFGSPEKKKARKSEDEESGNDRTKVESCANSVVAQLGSRPVKPLTIKTASSSVGEFDTSQLIIDHFSRIRLFKTSISLYLEEGMTQESVLRERNFGLQYVSLLNFTFWYRTKGAETKNFWTSGVLVRKQPGVRKSAKGNEYSLWEVNDLKQLDKSWTLFLFSSAVSAPSLADIRVGSLIDITTPSVMDSNKGGPIKFSINNSNQVRLVGSAKDFGFCQSKRKDGKDCTAVVNTWECCTCIHHATSELKKMKSGASSKKRERKPGVSFAQGTAFDHPPLNLHGEGVRTVNFGKPVTGLSKQSSSFTSAPKVPINLPGKGLTRMELQGSSVCSEVKRNSLSIGNATSVSFKKENNQLLAKLPSIVNPVPKPALNLDPFKTRHLTEKDRLILSALGSPSKSAELAENNDDDGDDSTSQQTSKKDKKLQKQQSVKPCSAEIASRIVSNPTSGSLNFMKYLTVGKDKNGQKTSEYNLHDTRRKEAEPISMTRETLRNMKKALDLVKSKGPIQRKDPNGGIQKRKSLPSGLKINDNSSSISASGSGGSSSSKTSASGSSSRGGLEVEFDFESDEFKNILNAKSVYDEHTTDLVQAEYFDKLVKKEAIENKLLNTFSIATNAVMCKQCKYVALGQSEYCKEQHHQIRVVKATKRFFKCKDCGNRTMSLDRLPKHPCKQCNSSNWLAAPVGKEKTGPILPTEVLSLRGHEEKFIGTSGSKMFLNLEVS
ncbi:protein MCM10 homolog [Folsomia candida]|uniref:Protein MCM10 homolog n=1 Tax=Folsomia candida TaxID=158441 RepID=A0A226EL91_FOLCA|nr:protein MCM10 homolog [Folsomia candida]XP_035706418.1 protein MCM10 homolog [Folsomia candida]XP_035706419.1 protein MCM10 homolog [Folsomia candida]OXA58463.1 Protein MCM10 [Folsomia candida]